MRQDTLNSPLAHRSRRDLRGRDSSIVLLPIGAVEQHGEHLPIGTDTMLADAVCHAAAEWIDECVVAPPIWYGFSPHHLPFGATVTVRASTLLALLLDLVDSLAVDFEHIIIVNGHGGNRGLLITLGLEGRCSVVDYWELARTARSRHFIEDLGSVGHAGQMETSIMLALHPELVGEPSQSFEPISDPDDPLFAPDLGLSGVLGNPLAADQELGRQFFAACVDGLRLWLDHLHTDTEPQSGRR